MGRFSKKRAVYSKKPRKERVWSPDGYLKSAFRKIWRWSPARRECLRARVCVLCAQPGKLYADHKDPVAPTEGAKIVNGHLDYNEFYERMFWGELNAICQICHGVKTKKENATRRLNVKNRRV